MVLQEIGWLVYLCYLLNGKGLADGIDMLATSSKRVLVCHVTVIGAACTSPFISDKRDRVRSVGSCGRLDNELVGRGVLDNEAVGNDGHASLATKVNVVKLLVVPSQRNLCLKGIHDVVHSLAEGAEKVVQAGRGLGGICCFEL